MAIVKLDNPSRLTDPTWNMAKKNGQASLQHAAPFYTLRARQKACPFFQPQLPYTKEPFFSDEVRTIFRYLLVFATCSISASTSLRLSFSLPCARASRVPCARVRGIRQKFNAGPTGRAWV